MEGEALGEGFPIRHRDFAALRTGGLFALFGGDETEDGCRDEVEGTLKKAEMLKAEKEG